MDRYSEDELDEFDIDCLENDDASKVYTEFLTGAAGTGKSFEVNRRLDEDFRYGLVAATTGIAAINLGEGVTTINAALGYFDTESLIDAYVTGRLTKRLRKLGKLGYKHLIIDEVSMMAAEQLDVIVKGLDETRAMGLVLTGDFLQLPPIKARWAFEADSWSRFAENTVKLTKCWRQANPDFQTALVAIRRGDGYMGTQILNSTGVEYAQNNALDFPGTTLVSKNDEVERFNWACHNKVQGRMTRAVATRWGKQRGEWKLIPEVLQVKIGAYVMILANKKDAWDSAGFEYVNGDCGTVVDFDLASDTYHVELKRNGLTVAVAPITRRNEQKERPSDELEAARLDGSRGPFWDEDKKRWVLGEVCYSPVRLAWATTVHKSQGLSLDAVQINLTNAFFGSYAMAYVALSRCRTPEGLRIIGSADLLTKRVNTDPKVKNFL